MGSHPSKCCFWNAPFSNNRTKIISDPIGSPLPETPLYQRRKRHEIQEQLLVLPHPSTTRNGSHHATTTTANNDVLPVVEGTIVHDGPDCERLLHEKYLLMEVLGVGSTSTVHRCVCRADETQQFACKIIDTQHVEERFAGMMAQFQTEIEALKELRHPGIIRLYDVYMTDQKIYIVMELMEGGELFDYVVQKGTLTEEEASKIVRKVTSALAYMHSKSFIHRDLKPENLLLKQTPKTPYDFDIDVKIIDFGLSKITEENVASTFLGTRGYLSPEQLTRREYTKAVDSWALGVIVFVLLCGCLPFDDDSSAITSDELVKLKFQLRYPRWAKNISPSAKDLLSKLLNTDPRARYTAEEALSHPWVRGDTAPRGNLLASPARIKKSPALVGSVRSNRFSGNRRATPRKDVLMPPTPPTPQQTKGTMTRKSSL